MDPNLKISDSDNRYGNPFSQPSSALPNKHMDYLSPHNIDFNSSNYAHASHSQDSKVIIRSSLGSPYLNYPQEPHQASQSHTLGRNSQENARERYESNYISPHTESANNRTRSSGRRISDADLDSLKNRTSGRGPKTSVYVTNAPQNVTEESGTTFLSSLPNSKSYGVGSNLHELIHGTNPQSSREESGNRREDVERLLSPEARRILNSPAAEDYKRQYPQPDRAPNRQLQPLAERAHAQPSHVSADLNNKTTRQAVPRLSELSAPSFARDSPERTKEYKIEEPHVSKRTIYTIQNTNTAAIKQGPTSEARSHRSPERSQRTARSSHSPFDNLRHSLKNEGTKISKIVIETVENTEEGELFYEIQNSQEKEKRFDLGMAKPIQPEVYYQSQSDFVKERPVPHDPQYSSQNDIVREQPLYESHQSRHDIGKEQPVLYEPHHQNRYGERLVQHEPQYQSQYNVIKERSVHESRYTSHNDIVREQPTLHEPQHQSQYNIHDKPHHQGRYDERPSPQEAHHQYGVVEEPALRDSNYQSMSPSISSLTNKRNRWSHEEPILKGSSNLRQEMEELRHDIAEYARTSTQLENLAELRNREKGGFVPRPGENIHHHYHEDDENEHHYHHEDQDHEYHHHDPRHHEYEHHRGQEEVYEKQKKAVLQPEKKVKEQEEVFKEPVVVKEKKPRHIIVKGVIGLLVILLCSLLWMELFTDIDLDDDDVSERFKKILFPYIN